MQNFNKNLICFNILFGRVGIHKLAENCTDTQYIALPIFRNYEVKILSILISIVKNVSCIHIIFLKMYLC